VDGTDLFEGSAAGEFLEVVLGKLEANFLLQSKQNVGLGPTINRALSHIDSLKNWDESSVPLTVYCQDDLIYSDGWLERLARPYLQLKDQLKLGFATGATCPEHKETIRQQLPNGMVLQDWIRATCLMADHRYWMSMWPISRIDPETGRERGKPGNGLGSSVDWWFVRNHPNSVCRTGRTNLVIPGLVLHDGFDQSTWLNANLPETAEDIARINEAREQLVEP
jgi:hypothetical protein